MIIGDIRCLITEGVHTKMEVPQRQAYGFRNFQNYRMRVKAWSRVARAAACCPVARNSMKKW
jgi:hypothetical protein